MTYEATAEHDARIDVSALIGAVVQRLPRIIVVTLVLLVVTFAALLFMPRLYESSASILVEARNNAYSRVGNEPTSTSSGNETGVVSSQIQLIKSRDTLLKVIDTLDLRSVPEFNGSAGGLSPVAMLTRLLGNKATPDSIDETVLNNRYSRLSVSQAGDSRLISVDVSSTDPQRAADIANAIADAHVARRAQLSLSDTAEASGWLSEEIDRLRLAVKDAETAVADFKVNNDLFVGSNNTSLADQQLTTVASQISSAQERKNTAISRAQLIRGMLERGQSIEGVADVRDSTVIQQLSEDKARLQGEMAQRSATLLSSHPTILALKAQISELDNQIAIEGRRVAGALEAEAQIEADLEKTLQAELTSAKASASTATQDNVTLDGLQREAKAQRDLLEGYLQRYNEAFSRTETSSALPDVRVVSVAAPSVIPASPKTQLILIAIGIVALAGQIGVIVFSELMSGRAIVAVQDVERVQVDLVEPPFAEDEVDADQLEKNDVPATADIRDEQGLGEEYAAALDQHTEPAFEPSAMEDVAVPDTRLDQRLTGLDQPAAVVPAPGISSLGKRTAEHAFPGAITVNDLTADLVLGKTHLVILAAHRNNDEAEAVAESLVAEAQSRGLSVAMVDAGSARIGDLPGLSDLSADAASFGDVVHKSADNSFAEVPWGRTRAIRRGSPKPMTLVEALGDIYEVVVLLTGKVGMNSTLPMFGGMNGRVVLVVGVDDDRMAITDSQSQLLDAGFTGVEVAQGPVRVAA